MIKQALEYLLCHLYKPLSNLTNETLDRFLKAANGFPIFTEKQKGILSHVVVMIIFNK